MSIGQVCSFSALREECFYFYPKNAQPNAKRKDNKMKKIISISVSLTLTLTLILCLASCGRAIPKEGLWEHAIYTKDTTLGNGATTAIVDFQIGEDKITFTVKTDKETVGAALNEHDLLEGEDGLYTKINGVVADWNVDGSYWAFYIDGEYAMTGLDDTAIDESATYSLVYTK